jgi:hypothetical protein
VTLRERLAAVTSGSAPEVEVGDTIRMLVSTGSTEHRAPDGGLKFRQGLIVLVDDVYLDAVSARRWVRNRIAEPFAGGTPGDVVTAEERAADEGDLDAEIARLERLRDRARARASAPPEPVDLRRDPSLAIGREPYRVPAEERPLARYGLADRQVEALEQAGFTRPDIIDAATDEEILDVRGVGKPTLAKLRGRAE